VPGWFESGLKHCQKKQESGINSATAVIAVGGVELSFRRKKNLLIKRGIWSAWECRFLNAKGLYQVACFYGGCPSDWNPIWLQNDFKWLQKRFKRGDLTHDSSAFNWVQNDSIAFKTIQYLLENKSIDNKTLSRYTSAKPPTSWFTPIGFYSTGRPH
jgi:hypothetical protein